MESQQLKRYLKVAYNLVLLLAIAFYVSLFFIKPETLVKYRPELLTYFSYILMPIIFIAAFCFIVFVWINIKKILATFAGKLLICILSYASIFIYYLSDGIAKHIVNSIFHVNPALFSDTTRIIGAIIIIPMWINFVILVLLAAYIVLCFLMAITTLPFMARVRKKFEAIWSYSFGLVGVLVLGLFILKITPYDKPNAYKWLATKIAVNIDCIGQEANPICEKLENNRKT